MVNNENNSPAPISDPNPDNLDNVSVSIGDAEPVVEPVVDAGDEGEVYEYDPTGDAGLDMALSFAGKQGLSEKHPAMVAAQKGDFSILKATLAAKGAAGWEQFVALAEQAYAKTSEKQKEKAAAVKKMVVEAAGGEQEWADVQKWAAANATPEEKAEINELLAKGGVSARGAVGYLVNAYARANNVEVNPADPTRNASRGGKGDSGGPLSASEYSAEVAKLHRALGGRLEGSPEYEKLQARRNAGRR